MAVYQGARPAPRPAFELPWLRPAAGSRRSGRTAAPTRATTRRAGHARTLGRAAVRPGIRGQRRVAMALSGIVIAFGLAFIQLSANVQVAASSYDVVRLQSEHDHLIALQGQLTSDIERLKGEPAIRKEALDAGLGQLGAPVLLPAR